MVSERQPPAVDAAKQQLRISAMHLKDQIGDAPVSLWDGDTLNVASTRGVRVLELRSKGVNNWSAEDYDFILFKCLTTMCDSNTLRFVVPRFFLACSTYPAFIGWTSESHVVLSKCRLLELESWTQDDAGALLHAVEQFALFEWAIDVFPNELDHSPPQGASDLLEFVDANRSTPWERNS